MNIDTTTLRLPDDQYYKEAFTKHLIVIHHTVGSSAKSTLEFWKNTPERVGTAYIIERNGVIYEVFNPIYWCHHLGLKSAVNTQLNRASIGIELASEGALRSGEELNKKLGVDRFDPMYLYAFDIDVSPFARAKKLYHKETDVEKYDDVGEYWRGYRYFDVYDPPQLDSLFGLVNHLCQTFNIPKRLLMGDRSRFDLSTVVGFEGVIGHCNVRNDKSDPSKSFSWTELEQTFV